MDLFNLKQQVNIACRRLLSEQNRDPYTPTFGCFDRRYWAWKLVDYPEATFQRNVYPLAWWLRHTDEDRSRQAEVLTEAVEAGLHFAVQIQHKDGSFDQAFPHEHSFGATAFLLHPLLKAYQIIRDGVSLSSGESIESSLRRAANFLCRHDEIHGHIANHLAGSVLSLLETADFFHESRYKQRAMELLKRVLACQSSEGWFLEYEGADPGYQTLCLYYLAQVYQRNPSRALEQALERAIEFIAYFVHPDGTFAGEYGSRRTALFYPGGLALLSQRFPTALSITRAMYRSICAGHTVTLHDIDMGNLAPLLSNYICALEVDKVEEGATTLSLPWEQPKVRQDFSQAGMYVRGTEHYYAVLGVSNGGVLKVFDKQQQRVMWDDGGYIGQLSNDRLVTTQMTVLDTPCTIGKDEIVLTSDFYSVLHSLPTPLRFVLLRLLNLTLMRNLWLGNLVKKGLVKLLIGGKRRFDMQLWRQVRFETNQVIVEDLLSKSSRLKVRWLDFGRKFIGIHMASTRYFEEQQLDRPALARQIDVEHLNRRQRLEVQSIVEASHA
jgi:hypothetical protein